jgi:aldose 1-epimerase
MPYWVRSEQRATTTGLDGTVWILEDEAGSRAEVWPALGFNCYRWLAPIRGVMQEVLYADPQLFQGSSPTRSGIPVLFPFPNRLRDGRFHWNGRDHQLPLNDPAGKNAIHGFTPRRPWRVVAQGVTREEAWLTGEFHGSIDAADARALWPADYQLRLTYRLLPGRLRLEAVVSNPDHRLLPFGLGYHPYFALPDPEAKVGCWVQVPADSFWELQDNLPTGRRLPVDDARDLNRLRSCAGLKLDDILTDLRDTAFRLPEGLHLRAVLQSDSREDVLRLYTSPDFRELVAFTPAHGRAIALEPYTCTTDAINLQQRGVEAGLLVLPPGEAWTGTVELAAG